MKDYKIIDKEEVWKALHEDKKIIACILETELIDAPHTVHLAHASVERIKEILSEDNVIFFEKIKGKDNELQTMEKEI